MILPFVLRLAYASLMTAVILVPVEHYQLRQAMDAWLANAAPTAQFAAILGVLVGLVVVVLAPLVLWELLQGDLAPAPLGCRHRPQLPGDGAHHLATQNEGPLVARRHVGTPDALHPLSEHVYGRCDDQDTRASPQRVRQRHDPPGITQDQLSISGLLFAAEPGEEALLPRTEPYFLHDHVECAPVDDFDAQNPSTQITHGARQTGTRLQRMPVDEPRADPDGARPQPHRALTEGVPGVDHAQQKTEHGHGRRDDAELVAHSTSASALSGYPFADSAVVHR